MGILGLAVADSTDSASSQAGSASSALCDALVVDPQTCGEQGRGSGEFGGVDMGRVLSECCDLRVRPINGCERFVGDRSASEEPVLGMLEQAQQSPYTGSERLRQFSSPPALRCSTSRSSSYDEDDDSGKWYFSPLSEFSQNISDTDSVCTSSRSELYSLRSAVSSPLDSPLKTADQGAATPQSERNGHRSWISPTYLSFGGSDDVDSAYQNSSCAVEEHRKSQKPIDFESNLFIWYPPKPADEGIDFENGYFEYDDEDTDVGDSAELFKVSSSSDEDAPFVRERPNLSHKEALRSTLHGLFKALVSQLLHSQGVAVGNDTSGNSWLEIVSSLAWEAANFVKPDTSKGGSMDPVDYVKVKCIASGCPADSTFIRGVVCSKNVKHKRMVLQHKNPRLFLLGGSLEYQKASNKLASINCVIEQEKEYLKAVLAIIEAQRPNVLLVEKSASSHTQDLLSKDLSLVLNVKRPLLERIARCTGAQIAPSIDNLASARLGQCKMFRVEREMEYSSPTIPGKKSMKTLMYFDGCPRRLGCTVILRGGSKQELKKIKNAVQYAVFAAYHLLLETSFLADEGASLPMVLSSYSASCQEAAPLLHHMSQVKVFDNESCKIKEADALTEEVSPGDICGSVTEQKDSADINWRELTADAPIHLIDGALFETKPLDENEPLDFQCSNSGSCHLQSGNTMYTNEATSSNRKTSTSEDHLHLRSDGTAIEVADDKIQNDSVYLSAAGSNQSILVSLSVSCPLKGTVCERPQLIRIKFYGTFDKPLGRFLCENLFDQKSCCPSCKERSEAHVWCYTHHQGSLTISVRHLPSVTLPGEQDGKIWMWHRCLKCKYKDGVPPATLRVVMSDAARGLSFGKFLELSFSNHTTAKRIANCGHSLQKDCLRFYGFGSMVAAFRHSPVDILSVHLPLSVLNFSNSINPEWIKREVASISSKKEFLFKKIFAEIDRIEKNISSVENETLKNGIEKFVIEMKDLLKMGSIEFDSLLQSGESSLPLPANKDVLKLNILKRELLESAHLWSRRIYVMDCLTKEDTENAKADRLSDIHSGVILKEISRTSLLSRHQEDISPQALEGNTNMVAEMDLSLESYEGYLGTASYGLMTGHLCRLDEETPTDEEFSATSMELSSSVSSLSDQIDLAWTGSDQVTKEVTSFTTESLSCRAKGLINYPSLKTVVIPSRTKSFDHALSLRNRTSPSTADDLKMSMRRAYSQKSPQRSPRTDDPNAETLLVGCLTSDLMIDGGRILPQNGQSDTVVLIYDEEPSSMIAYALTSREYENYLSAHLKNHSDGPSTTRVQGNSPDLKEINFTVTFEDSSAVPAERAKFSVTSYYARHFDLLRKQSCPCALDFVRSLSRCKRWNAQGGKSSAYFAKTLDDRFILKQVSRAELVSFDQFAVEYFRYLMESSASGSPTCIAKVLGIYHVVATNLRGGKEIKMDLMVMENLFYKRNISRIYDLKGSLRSRYNPDTSGSNKVLLDLNLLETLHTKPIFLGSKAKRQLERAVWNDTVFLSSVDVMDYSLLVGIDEGRKELVIGIIDFLRQYTWDKQLETWVKASGILGGPKNTLPTVISPIQYKKRFRKAMSEYFLTVPDPPSP